MAARVSLTVTPKNVDFEAVVQALVGPELRLLFRYYCGKVAQRVRLEYEYEVWKSHLVPHNHSGNYA